MIEKRTIALKPTAVKASRGSEEESLPIKKLNNTRMESIKRWVNKNHGNLAYAVCCMGFGCMSSVFSFYYVDVFINKYHVSQWWFQVAQVIYMIWNAINDPLFGYWIDNCNITLTKSRRHSILLGAPVFVCAFLVPWFPWVNHESDLMWVKGIHLIVSLCLYDALFTFVVLSWCCLQAEMSQDHDERLLRMRLASVTSLLVSPSVLICQIASSNFSNFTMFQVTTVAISVFALGCMTYTGLNGHTMYDRQNAKKKSIDLAETGTFDDRKSDLSAWTLSWQLLTQSGCLVFIVANLLNGFHGSYRVNFASILGRHLVPEEAVHPTIRSICFGSLFIIPSILVLVGTPLLSRIGYYKVYKVGLLLKLITSSIVYLIGQGHPWIFMAFMIVESMSQGICSTLQGIALSDVIDADMILHKRKHPLSSMVFGINALIAKPGESLAPMLAVYVFNAHGYGAVSGGNPTDASPDLLNAMFTLSCAVPFCIGLIQLLLWTKYPIRNSHRLIHEVHDCE